MIKKLFFSILILAFAKSAFASTEDWNNIPISSYTDAASGGAVLFTSQTVQFVGITVSSPSPNAVLAIFRSTSSIFTPDVATQTLVNMDYQAVNTNPNFVPMFEMRNASYTYINKVGAGKITIWFRCPNNLKPGVLGLCPGMNYSGQR